jgi:Rieske Fe-S protein
VNGSANGNTVVVNIDANSPLSNVRSAALVQSSLGLLLVAHTAAGTFTALASTCTHQACTISGFDNQRYVCPCHGSTFDTNGRVLGGPAPAALRQFATGFNAGVLTITV